MVEMQQSPASAVLVHGSWGRPDDWRWVRQLLEERGVSVATPDLPSHSLADAGLTDDVAIVREAFLASPRPTVAVGWSYGCDVIGVAADGVDGVTRLVYVSSAPQPLHPDARDDSFLDANPSLVWENGRFKLDDAWLEQSWHREFSAEVHQYFTEHPRRFVTRRTQSDPVEEEAWRSIPTVVLIGTQDVLTDAESRARARRSIEDVRDVDCDHFIPFRRPDLIVDAIMESGH
ncbi:MAG TPA: alpha/beta hydrolase [Leifsonia sp.]|jgi:pimeloyl-ACP methyl ester carboxylesterase|nr:alpha/beta hydrolase [Leifsonia sp.]